MLANTDQMSHVLIVAYSRKLMINKELGKLERMHMMTDFSAEAQFALTRATISSLLLDPNELQD